MLLKEIKDDTDRKIHNVLGVAEPIMSNDYATQDNLQIQCSTYQMNNCMFQRTRRKKNCMEPQRLCIAKQS